MKAKVNIQLLNTTNFDSGALGMLAMVLHQFSTAGNYRATIMEKGFRVTDVNFQVKEKSEVMQLDIDLAKAVRDAKARPEKCGSRTEEQTSKVVSPMGYVLFHASSGDGYSVIVSNGDSEEVFDSTKLGAGDIFAVSLLEPSKYSMKNTMGSAAGEILVRLKPDLAKQINTIETRHIEVSEKKFDPERIELASSQGLVFRIVSAARIVVEKKDPSRAEHTKPTIRWQKLQAARKQIQSGG